MKPPKTLNEPDLYRCQLSNQLNMKHSLIQLSYQIDWDSLAKEINMLYTEKQAHPPLPSHLLVGLHYLKYTFNESDESVVLSWLDNRGYNHLHTGSYRCIRAV